jgi:hypothetical protein
MIPSGECTRAAKFYLLEKAQKGLKVKGTKMFAADVLTVEEVLGVCELIILVSRVSSQIPKIYSKPHLPLMNGNHPMDKMYMGRPAEQDMTKPYTPHVATKNWVIGGMHLAEAVHRRCTDYRLKCKACLQQKIWPLPNHQVDP